VVPVTAGFLDSRLEGYVNLNDAGRYWHQTRRVTFRSARSYVVRGRLTSEFTVEATPEDPFACDLESWELAEWQATGLAGLVHDKAYRSGDLSRADADALYHEALRTLGLGRARAWVRWAGVRAFGRGAWKGHRAAELARLAVFVPLALGLLGSALWFVFVGLLVAVRWPL
jgi:hypothetical protein